MYSFLCHLISLLLTLLIISSLRAKMQLEDYSKSDKINKFVHF